MEKSQQPGKLLGRHAIIDLSGCDSEIIKNYTLVKDILISAAEVAKVTVIGIIDRHFAPQGYTAVLLLEESHLSIHTWPEYDYASVDLYSCNLRTDFEAVKQFLANEFKAADTTCSLLERRCVGSLDTNTVCRKYWLDDQQHFLNIDLETETSPLRSEKGAFDD
jgi:S-adenosylmethionine decarboxylase proenzyme